MYTAKIKEGRQELRPPAGAARGSYVVGDAPQCEEQTSVAKDCDSMSETGVLFPIHVKVAN